MTIPARNGHISFWQHRLGPQHPRPALPGPRRADVAIVGAGFTGLWTAYYLKRHAPDLDVVVLEANSVGYGASGRNGGWLANTITGGRNRYATSHGMDAATTFQRALNDTVDEVISVAEAETIDADIARGGELTVATNRPQLARLHAFAGDEERWPATDVVRLDPAETRARVAVAPALGGLWHPHCARINPAKLVRGVAAAAERAGVTIYEQTRVTEIVPYRAKTALGDVSADHVIRATEGFTPHLTGQHRTWLPMNSSMIVTEPLPDAIWDEIGWQACDTLGDMAHAYMYAQHTADGRIALGGRGNPYLYGSRTDTDGETPQATVDMLAGILHTFFPATHGAALDHAWSGVLGVPRDWTATVGVDPRTGLGWAGGYVGTGVTATNLAGRTLADLVLARDTDITHLPWVGRTVRRWEPEPLRWLAVHTLYRVYYAADRSEERRTTTSPLARIADKVSGMHG